MKDYVHEHFKKHAGKQVKPHIVCADGTCYSVQASKIHYCYPNKDNAEWYAFVEIWSPFTKEPERWVSVHNVNRRIHRRGGIQ